MKVAAIYDIHANLPALEAVLAELSSLRVDMLVVGGDVISGPLPNETLARLNEYQGNKLFLKGNAESDLLSCLNNAPMNALSPRAAHEAHWLVSVLKNEYKKQIANWHFTTEINSPELGRMLFCHATPRDNVEIFTEQTPLEQLRPMLSRCNADLIICGHTHMQFERRLPQCRIVNAGSVGMPVGTNSACWLLLDHQISFKQTPYDVQAAAQLIRQSGYPDAENFVQQQVLSAPEEAEFEIMLTQMARQQLRPAS
ncbi:metallophosphoesterase family protein [Shewanella mangrovi]|uniref:metallophosphoesterase family protein n=1 Tax=Shewanella mangrovi TaxID=1515746 RepID=UPI00068E119B|nr:metallophosphoesterase family protein [Shewanella mangrovi]